LVVICGQQNYKLDTKHAIAGVIEEGTREGEVRGSISSNRIVHKKFRDLRLRRIWTGGGGVVCREASVIKLYFLLFLKSTQKIPRPSTSTEMDRWGVGWCAARPP
jgi:hypothetical protein